MKLFIRSAGNISPQHSLQKDIFFARKEIPSATRMMAIEPDYTVYVDNKMIRRMSRIVKMGVAAALSCLRQAENLMPQAIITGTAYGCLEDTGIFLRRMIDNKEELLTPTAFIQSTHNTVGAQIALLLKCHGYNNTIVQRGFSFENALTDATLLLREGWDHVLTGAIDEITADSHALLSRFGLYRQPTGNVPDSESPGPFAGEGAAFFLLGSRNDQRNLAVINRVETIYKPKDFNEVEHRIRQLLLESELTIGDIDLILTGENGNARHDALEGFLSATVFKNKKKFPFKNLCGEYPTASGFAVWLACILISEQSAPAWFPEILPSPKHILICNHDPNGYHALYLISAS